MGAEKIKNSSEGKSASLVIKNISLIELNRLHFLSIKSGQSAKNSLQYGFFVSEKGHEAKALVIENNKKDNHNPSTDNTNTGMIFFVTGFVLLVIGIVALLLLRRI